MSGWRVMAPAALALMLVACSTAVVREGGNGARGTALSTAKVGATTVVARGDNLYRIALSNGIGVQELAAWNGIPVPYTIYPGQRLRLYPPSGARTVVSRAPSQRPAVARRGSATTPRHAASPRTAAVAAAPVQSNIAWRWPADGTLVSRYVAGEPTKQGVDIAGSSGAPVRAAGDGVVVYSGSGLVGYGELIIVKHNDAWLSAYGHNRNRLVNEGQLVKAGQQIAEMGRSGAARDMLHFEVRYNGKPVDPLQYLPKR